jgi:glycosyltransferase involved in cell wall biosynthesis
VFYATPDLALYVRDRRPDAEFLPNPVDAQRFAPAVPARESRDVYVCCSLTDIKGAVRILSACRRLAETRPDIRITAIGGGAYTEAFRRLPNVTLIPHQRRSELPAVINRHGVVVGQMQLGAVGMAELEAMACGRPVISWFAYPKAYAEVPPLIRVVDGYDIALAIVDLVDHADVRQEIGDAGRAWVQRYHDVQTCAARVESVAQEMLARR